MSERLPAYYTSLVPFAGLFQSGWPILTYHKLGPRPVGVRLKGLYVSAGLFERQVAELRQAGFASTPLDPGVVHNGARHVTVTFDDGFRNVLDYGLETLATHQCRAIQFLVADLIGKANEWEQREGEAEEPLMDVGQSRGWLAAGHEIGSHSLTHPWLTRLPVSQAKEEILASKKKLEDLFGRPIHHFCYPYGDWNPAVRDLVAEAGYRTACTTEPGVNLPETDALGLKRFTARYRSRSFKAFWSRLRGTA